MSELAKRAMTGAVYAGLTIAAAVAGPVTSTLLFLPVCLVATQEMLRLLGGGKESVPTGFPLAAAAITYVVVALASVVPRVTPMVAAAVVFMALFAGVIELLWRPDARPARELGALVVVVAAIALPFGLIPALMHRGPELFIGFMLLLWTNDTGAYLVGRSIGRTPLLPRVSPKKTVEGLLGGTLLALAAGWAIGQWWTVLSPAQWLFCGGVVAVASTVGDLLESALKREAGVKDSGTILPGHGGMLDRFDGFILALPAMVLTVHLFA